MQDIVIELMNSLDHEVGGEISKELESLYEFIIHQSTQANINFDKEPLTGVLNILTTLYDGWNKAVKSLKGQNEHQAENRKSIKEYLIRINDKILRLVKQILKIE